MAMVKCPECGNMVSGSAAACPNCGYDVAGYFRQIEDRRKAEEERQKARAEEIAKARKRMSFRFAVIVIWREQYKDNPETFHYSADTFDSRGAAESKTTEENKKGGWHNKTGSIYYHNESVELMEAPEGKYFVRDPELAWPPYGDIHIRNRPYVKDDGLRDIPSDMMNEYREAQRRWKQEETAAAERQRQEAERQRKAAEAAEEEQHRQEEKSAATLGVTVDIIRAFGIKGTIVTKNNGLIGDVSIPSGVTGIEDWSFYSCKGLTSVTIPASVTSIGTNAFPFEASVGTWIYKEGRGWKKKGCFITTAVYGAFGKADDCRELTAFRAFRDTWLAKQPGGEALIAEYYDIAPGIVAAIDRSANRDAVYRGIWDTYLADCLHLIDAGDFAGCKGRYVAMVEGLKAEWL